ncbi:Protein trichome birefringence, partial [Linum perenne]
KQSSATADGDGLKQRNETVKQGIEALVESLKGCDFFDGKWVMDDSYPLYKPGSYSFIDEQFNCILNGRPDKDYQKYKCKPHGCNLPRLNPGRLLDMLRGKRLVFVGDSLDRNMWESMVYMLKGAAKDQNKVYDVNGKQNFRCEASYSFIFKDYDCTVEFFVTPFLVQEWEMKDNKGLAKETLRLDLIGQSSNQYKTVDFIVFNTGHWWTHEKTSLGYNKFLHLLGRKITTKKEAMYFKLSRGGWK